MSETENRPTDTEVEPGVGPLLRKARESRGASLADVATALKMSPRQIAAIEEEDFDKLAGITFVRGFVRNYARLMKLDPEAILSLLPAQEAVRLELHAPVDVGVRMPSSGERQGKSLLMGTAAAFVLLIIALGLYFELIDFGEIFKFSLSSASPGIVIAEKKLQPQEILPDLQSDLVLTDQSPQTLSENPEDPNPERLQNSDTSSEISLVESRSDRLTFRFEGSSWVEIQDASGHTIFSQMNAKGTHQVVTGRPPFQLVIGNASQVNLTFNDQWIDLKPYTRVDVARLTLE